MIGRAPPRYKKGFLSNGMALDVARGVKTQPQLNSCVYSTVYYYFSTVLQYPLLLHYSTASTRSSTVGMEVHAYSTSMSNTIQYPRQWVCHQFHYLSGPNNMSPYASCLCSMLSFPYLSPSLASYLLHLSSDVPEASRGMKTLRSCCSVTCNQSGASVRTTTNQGPPLGQQPIRGLR